jgi:hypothetical protein
MLGVECGVDLMPVLFPGVRPMKEFARAAFLHDMRARPARQLAESIRAVHDRVRWDLSVAKHEVAVCWQKKIIKNFSFCITNSLDDELDGPAVSALGARSRKLSNIGRSTDG